MNQIGLFDPPKENSTWKSILKEERELEYFKNILSFIEKERRAGKIIYPKNTDIFNSLAFTEFNAVKVVILGQDPYHGPNQAHGLCFSVKPGIAFPPSLKNIFKEMVDDLRISYPTQGCLEPWARQGVLLLNTTLTVEAGKPQSHAQIGWSQFTDKIISEISQKKSGVVFLLWGSPAQKKINLIEETKHFILKAPHPSPLSASRGFFGCRHFSRTNEILKSQGKGEINWALP